MDTRPRVDMSHSFSLFFLVKEPHLLGQYRYSSNGIPVRLKPHTTHPHLPPSTDGHMPPACPIRRPHILDYSLRISIPKLANQSLSWAMLQMLSRKLLFYVGLLSWSDRSVGVPVTTQSAM